MINKSFAERMGLAWYSWEQVNKDDLVRVKRKNINGDWRTSIRTYMPFAKDILFISTSTSLKEFFDHFIKEKYCTIEKEGHIAVLVDEILYRRRNRQLEFDFEEKEKVTG